MPKTDREHTTRPLGKLKPHPRQAGTFPDLSEADLTALAADMKANGLQHPIEILPDGTVLAGHQRLRAAKRLGWKIIAVVVRHDLAAAGEKAATAYFIADNLNRRQLSPLGKARCVAELFELEVGCRTERMYGEDKDRLKAAVAKRLDMSVRNVNRYLLALKAPLAVQAAFDRGHLTLTEVGRIALLSGGDAEAVGRAIDAVYADAPADPADDAQLRRDVRAAAFEPTERDAGEGKTSLYRLVRALRRELPLVRAGLDGIEPKALANVRPVLAEAQSVFAMITDPED